MQGENGSLGSSEHSYHLLSSCIFSRDCEISWNRGKHVVSTNFCKDKESQMKAEATQFCGKEAIDSVNLILTAISEGTSQGMINSYPLLQTPSII